MPTPGSAEWLALVTEEIIDSERPIIERGLGVSRPAPMQKKAT